MRPAEDIVQTIHAAIEARAERQRKYAALRDLPSVTRDQARIGLHMNAGLLIDMQHLDETGADGVGLYRTEIPFMVRSEFPDVDAQAWLYSRVLDVADGKPVTFRTLDVGGDKVLPYVGAFGDDNPAMGWRAIRIGLDRPAMLRRQLRALIQAANGRPLSVMFPMIAEVSELLGARKLLELELDRAKRRGLAVPGAPAGRRDVRGAGAGVAARQPAAARRLHLRRHQRSIAIFVRGRPRQHREWPDATTPCPRRCFDCYILWLRRPGRPGVDLSVCGEMAGRPVEALALLALGVRTLVDGARSRSDRLRPWSVLSISKEATRLRRLRSRTARSTSARDAASIRGRSRGRNLAAKTRIGFALPIGLW